MITRFVQLPYKNDPQGYAEIDWTPVDILDLRRFKEAVILYGTH